MSTGNQEEATGVSAALDSTAHMPPPTPGNGEPEVRPPTLATPSRKEPTIRRRLAMLVVICVLPVWIAAGLLILYSYQTKRALTEQHMLNTARTLTLMVDRELSSAQSGLRVLAASEAFARRDWITFHQRAQVMLPAYPGAAVILADPAGQQLVNTSVLYGTSLPKRNAGDETRLVFENGTSVITNLFHGALSRRPLIGVDVPVLNPDGRVGYDLALTFPVEYFSDLLARQQLPDGWIVRLFDRNYVAIARNRSPEKFVGRTVLPELQRGMGSAQDGLIHTRNLEAIPLFNAFSRSTVSGWTMVVGVPRSIMMAAIWRELWWAAVGSALLSLLGILLALHWAHLIAGPIQRLVAPALALGRGEAVTIGNFELAEIREVGESLAKASELIRQRTAERERTAAAQRETEDLKRFNAELERSEAEARARAEELAAIMDAVPAVTLIAYDQACQRISSNRSGYELYRVPPGTNISKSGSDVDHLAHYRILNNGRELAPQELPIQRAAATGEEIRGWEQTVAFADGSSREIFGNSVPLLDAAGKVRGAVGAFIDITDRKRAEEAVRKSQERFRQIVEGAPVGMYMGDFSGVFRYLNPAALRILGAERLDQLLGQPIWERIPAEYWPEARARIADMRETGRVQPYTDRQYLRIDGSRVDVEVSAMPFEFEGREGIVVFLHDITDRKRAEEAVRESEKRFRQVVESAPVGLYIRDHEGRVRYLNPAALAMFGAANPAQMLYQSIWDRFHPKYRQRALDESELVKNKRQCLHHQDGMLLRLDGSPFEVDITIIPFQYEGDDRAAAIFFRDLTQQRRAEKELAAAEERLRQAAKLESIGRLAGGVAHDFNNLLMVIRSYAEMLQDEVGKDPKLARETGEILKAADRASSLTSQMLAFSRNQILSPKIIDLNEVIGDTARMLKRLIGEEIELRTELDTELWPVEADPDQMAQVLMNLSVNARDAIADYGTLTISTGNVTVGAAEAGAHPCAAAGDYAYLAVRDTGAGMSKQVQERIFEPFFTTKIVGKGTGLGLSMVYGIVKQSGGCIAVESAPGAGACFTIYLPRSAKTAAHSPAPRGKAPRHGNETILVAEDEEALRGVICEVLGKLGYKILEAASGEEALTLASEHQGRIDLLLTDVVMPRMSGREVSQVLTTLHPHLKTLYMSGYTDDAVVRRGVNDPGVWLLQKPFSLTTLASTVADVIQSH